MSAEKHISLLLKFVTPEHAQKPDYNQIIPFENLRG